MDRIAARLIKNQEDGIYPEQKSAKWYEMRDKILTASDCATALECNKYETARELLIRKIASRGAAEPGVPDVVAMPNPQAVYMEWGTKYEPVAKRFYENLAGVKVFDLGLIIHSQYPWLGASPDGITLAGKLIEIKCPFRRQITGEIPHYYWIQIQIQLEVCQLEECDFVDCSFSHERQVPDEVPEKYYIQTVRRDREWFAKNIGALRAFWDAVLAGTADKFRDWSEWVAATKTRNYAIGDPIIDWLEHTSQPIADRPADHSVAKPQNFGFTQFLKKRGVEFEKFVVGELKQMFPRDFLEIANENQARSQAKFDETAEAIRRGVPIIYHGVLHNATNRTYGMPDLIVRSDWLNKIFEVPPLAEPKHETPELGSRPRKKCRVATKSVSLRIRERWHYRIVDIKFTTLRLRCDGKHLLKTPSTEAMKAQLYVYNTALSTIQNYRAPKAYIIGRRWQYCQNGVQYEGDGTASNWRVRAGHINFKTCDNYIKHTAREAILWIHKVRKYGNTLSANPPSCSELYPNMCNIEDGSWRVTKIQIANDIKEITCLWQCGIKHRKIAHSRGIFRWDDPRCSPETLGIFGDKIANTLQHIININRSGKGNTQKTRRRKSTESDIWPPSVQCNYFRKLRNEARDIFFVDFETINLASDLMGSFIFMIGVGRQQNEVWQYKSFVANNLSADEEFRIISEFHAYCLGTHSESEHKPKLVHWSHAEKTFYRGALARHAGKFPEHLILKDDNWYDLLKLFRDEPIVVRGALNFSLKSIAKAFYEHKFIATTWPQSEVSDGLTAMVRAHECYSERNQKKQILEYPIMMDILRYNEVDCRVLWEIFTFLGAHAIEQPLSGEFNSSFGKLDRNNAFGTSFPAL